MTERQQIAYLCRLTADQQRQQADSVSVDHSQDRSRRRRNLNPDAAVRSLPLLAYNLWAHIAEHPTVRGLGRLACGARRFGLADNTQMLSLVEEAARCTFMRFDTHIQTGVPRHNVCSSILCCGDICDTNALHVRKTWLQMLADAVQLAKPLRFTHYGTTVKIS